MKKFVAIFIIAILAISTLIFPAMAAVNANSVSWDGGLDWLNQYQVRGWVEIYSYTGILPEARVSGVTNSGEGFDASQMGVGFKYSNIASCNLQGSFPLVTSWRTWVEQ